MVIQSREQINHSFRMTQMIHQNQILVKNQMYQDGLQKIRIQLLIRVQRVLVKM